MDDRSKPQSVLRHLNQEKIVFILTIVLFILFSIILPNFLAANNILSLIRSVAVLGILGLGMLIVVLGRGIDLSLVVTSTSAQAMNTRVVNSNMIYDVILVVVLGGVGLSGGRGNVRNVIVGTLLIGVLMNGMTIMDIQYTVQNVIKSLILLLAIVADSILNPRDEQTGQQGDI